MEQNMMTIKGKPVMGKLMALAACLALAAGLACAWAVSAYAADTGNTTDSKNVTISFDGNGGTIEKAGTNTDAEAAVNTDANASNTKMSPQVVEKDKKVKLKANKYTRKGYSFKGWNTKKDGKGTSYKDKAELTPTENITLYAQWTEESKDENAEPDATGADKGGAAAQIGTQDAKTDEGTNDAGDKNDNADENAEGKGAKMGTQAEGDKTVTFYKNAESATGEMAVQTLTEGKGKLTKNAFAYTGYTFKNWATEEGGGGTTYADEYEFTEDSPLTEDLTLYAQWELEKLTVTFDKNGGTGTMANQTVNYNVGTALDKNKFTRDGYEFTGWKDSNGNSYTNGGTYAFTANTTLYAQWEENTITVKFKANGGTGTMTNQTMTPGEKTALKANKFTRDGYDFDSWNTKKDGSGKTYSNKASVSFDSDTTLYAQWERNTITVSFKANGGSGTMNDQTMNSGEKTKLSSNKFTRTGYTFNGWNTKSDGKGTSYSNNASASFNSDTTLYAQWKKNSSNSSTKGNTSKSSTPKTGDELSALPIAIVALLAACVAAFAFVRTRSRKESTENDNVQS